MEEKTLLIIEDDANLAYLLARMLQAPGRRVLVVHDGLAGLETARFVLPDAVVLDVRLPGLSGHDVCRAIRSDAGTRGMPVIMVSGFAEIDDQLDGLAAGADTYVAKPFDPEDLRSRVEAILR